MWVSLKKSKQNKQYDASVQPALLGIGILSSSRKSKLQNSKIKNVFQSRNEKESSLVGTLLIHVICGTGFAGRWLEQDLGETGFAGH